jgi:hypothetical protein
VNTPVRLQLWRCLALLVASLQLLAMASARRVESKPPPPPVFFFASQSGGVTLDSAESGGNPFASALIELLSRSSLNFSALEDDLIGLTMHKSRGVQLPERLGPIPADDWDLVPAAPREIRIALVVVFANYAKAGRASLPGARRDAVRVSSALRRVGFEVRTLIDPAASELDSAFGDFGRRTEVADAAVIYTTGHGIEVDSEIFLLPGDMPLSREVADVPALGLRIERFAAHLRAQRVNLLFYAGCRSHEL